MENHGTLVDELWDLLGFAGRFARFDAGIPWKIMDIFPKDDEYTQGKIGNGKNAVKSTKNDANDVHSPQKMMVNLMN